MAENPEQRATRYAKFVSYMRSLSPDAFDREWRGLSTELKRVYLAAREREGADIGRVEP